MRESGLLFPQEPCWKLTPSELVFLWEECKRCFYLKLVDGVARPRTGMPKIFTTIDSKMKDCLIDERTDRISRKLPPGFVKFGEKWVQSKAISLKSHSTSCYIRGKLDAALAFDDGAYGVVDFKTSKPSPAHANLYFKQLNAYAYSLQNPALGKLSLSPVTHLGLLVFEPELFLHNGGGSATMAGSLSWIDVPQDVDRFLGLIGDVLSVLERAEPPPSDPGCEWCKYRENGLPILTAEQD